jgi:hypothetical protein
MPLDQYAAISKCGQAGIALIGAAELTEQFCAIAPVKIRSPDIRGSKMPWASILKRKRRYLAALVINHLKRPTGTEFKQLWLFGS